MRGIHCVALSFVVFVSTGTAIAQIDNTVRINAPQRLRKDALGDPLPAKALLRLGTKRLQHPSGPSQIILSR